MMTALAIALGFTTSAVVVLSAFVLRLKADRDAARSDAERRFEHFTIVVDERNAAQAKRDRVLAELARLRPFVDSSRADIALCADRLARIRAVADEAFPGE